jgi:hypothetical protein
LMVCFVVWACQLNSTCSKSYDQYPLYYWANCLFLAHIFLKQLEYCVANTDYVLANTLYVLIAEVLVSTLILILSRQMIVMILGYMLI